MGDINTEPGSQEQASSVLTQDCYKALTECVKSVNAFPTGAARNLFSTYTGFNAVIDHLSENVLAIANAILASQGVRAKFKKSENNDSRLLSANDQILDSTHEVMIRRPQQIKSTTEVQRVAMPQSQPDNQRTAKWMPKLTTKPNSLQPLVFRAIQNHTGHAVGYEHPYIEELDGHQFPKEWEKIDKNLCIKSLESTPFKYVDTESDLEELADHLDTVDEIAVDLEHHSAHSFIGLTCLLQVSTESGGDWIVDTIKLQNNLTILNRAFTNPNIKKILHGAKNDIIWLQRDCGVYIINLFDTHEAAKLLELRGRGLSDLVRRFCQVNLDKMYQMADWRLRPLPEPQLKYARMDTHYLIYICHQMTAMLADTNMNFLRVVHERGLELCKQTYVHPTFEPDDYLRFVNPRMGEREKKALQMLLDWRDNCARNEDESTGYILPNHSLVNIAEKLPRDVQGILACCAARVSPYLMRDLYKVNKIILQCRNSCEDVKLPTPPPPPPPPPPPASAAAVRRRKWRPRRRVEQFPKHQMQWRVEPSTSSGVQLGEDAALFLPPYTRYVEYLNRLKVMGSGGPDLDDWNSDSD